MMTGAFSTLHVLGAASFAPMARYSGFAATRSSAVGPRMVYNVDAAMAVDGQSSMYNFADGAGTVAARPGPAFQPYTDANSEALEAVDSGSSMYSFVDGTSTPQQRLRRSRWAGTQNPYAMNRRRRMLDMTAPYEDEMYGGGAYDVPPPPYDMAPPPYDEMPPPQPYDRMGMEPPPYDLERRIVELERALMGNGGAMGGGVMGGGMGMGGRLDWLDSQLGPTSGPDMDRLSRLEDMARRQGLYDNYGGGSMLGFTLVSPEMDPVIMAAALVLLTLIMIWMLGSKPRFPQTPLPYGIFDEKGVLWHRDSVGTHKATLPGITTGYEIMKSACAKGGAMKTAGKRRIVKRHWVEHDGKKVEKLELSSEYEWMTYADFDTQMHAIGSGMVSLASLAANDCVIIYAETAREWFLAAQGAFTQGLTVVTIYATLGEEGFTHGAAQTKAKLVVADAKLLKVLGKVFKSKDPKLNNLKKVVYIPDEPLTPDKIVADQTLEAIAEISSCGVEVFLAYLPLAHIMEMAAELMCYFIGMQVGYGSPHTLTPTGVKVYQGANGKSPYPAGGSMGDAQCLKPSLMVFAPAVLDKVYIGLNQKMAAASPVVQKLFKWGLAAGERRYDQGLIGSSWFYNKIVFKKVQALLGGNLKACITGSAPLSPSIQKFAQTCFNCPVRQGYGLTETCASSVIGEACENATGIIGPPTTSTSIKLRDWEEGGYRLSDATLKGVEMPRGEILIGGPMVCKGYFVDKSDPDPDVVAKNKSEFVQDTDGVTYFCTGDIGQVNRNGCVQIIDRKKDLVKLQQGEYVALSKVENAMKNCTLVEVPCCYAESTYDYCVALVCPSHLALKALAKTLGVASEDVAVLCEDPKIVAEVSKQILAAVKGKLTGFEIPKKVALIADTFTPENEMLTSAFKLKRKPIADQHRAVLNKLYGKK
eukprot:jgi/Chrpa1/13937/Chrysochromulina_OHIO_Genome00012491-RA